MKTVRVTTGAALGLWAAASPAAACPTCRDALAASDAKWAHGFSVSVLFLLAVLVVVVGTFSFAVWRATRSPRAD
jgi:heme/copper-type cytochrome/quinol oxidase subunit 2